MLYKARQSSDTTLQKQPMLGPQSAHSDAWDTGQAQIIARRNATSATITPRKDVSNVSSPSAASTLPITLDLDVATVQTGIGHPSQIK